MASISYDVALSEYYLVDGSTSTEMRFLGELRCNNNPLYPSGSPNDLYAIKIGGKVGGALGKTVVQGDALYCVAANYGGVESENGTAWVVLNEAFILGVGSDANSQPSTLYVESNGSDESGGRGNSALPYATLSAALADASAGDTIKVGIGTFASYDANAGNWKNGITIEGSGMPTFNNVDPSAATALSGGTIFQGNFGGNRVLGTSALRGLRFRNFGVDVGDAWCDANNAGVEEDALGFVGDTTYPITDFVFENIVCLGKNTGVLTAAHGLSVSGGNNISISNCVGVGNVYGFAIFAENFNFIGNSAFGNYSNGAIFKVVTDQPCANGNISGFVAADCTGAAIILNRGVHDINLNGISAKDCGSILQFLLDSSANQYRIHASNLTGEGVTDGVKVTYSSSGIIYDSSVSNASAYGTLGASSVGFNPTGAIDLSECFAENFESGFLLTSASLGRKRALTARANTYGINLNAGVCFIDEPIALENNTNSTTGLGSLAILPQIFRLRSWSTYLENSTSETTLISSGEVNGTRIIPAELATRTIKVTAGGDVNTVAGTSAITIRLKLGTNVLCSNSITPTVDGRWTAQWIVQIRDGLADASAAMHTASIVGAGPVFSAGGNNGTLVDWTGNDASRTLDVTGQWAVADPDNEINMDSMTIELPAWSLAQLP